MTRKPDRPTARVQVYFDNPKVEAALRREARASKVPMSRAAERAIERGLQRRPQADAEDRLLALERSLRDHMRATARDMAILQELLVEFARAFFARLPDCPGDTDPLMLAAVEARIEKMLDQAAYRLVSGSTRKTSDLSRHADLGSGLASAGAHPGSLNAAE
jgi:hypothetical protein